MVSAARFIFILFVGGLLVNTSCMAYEGASESEFALLREAMVTQQIEGRGVRDAGVLRAMRVVPRHWLVPEDVRRHAYEDTPLPIGWGQTISQPFIVALMSELLELKRGDRVLEVGTGSGYQAAVLAEMGVRVFSIEIVEPLAKRAKAELASLGYTNASVRAGDGYLGWPDEEPFDGIIVTAGATHVPQPLVDQLKPGGRMVIPVGASGDVQALRLIVKSDEGVLEERDLLPVRFVPLTGEHAEKGP